MRNTRFAMLALTSLLLVCCKESGAKYRDDLFAAIEEADTVVITEHSDREDFIESDSIDSANHPHFEYGRIELDATGIKQFSADVQAMDPATQDAWPACIFEPHHTIQFYDGESVSSTMVVCFKCGQVKWNGTSATNPWSLMKCLEPVVVRAGFQPERDWAALAKKQSEQVGTEQPATRSESILKGGDKPQPESEGRSR